MSFFSGLTQDGLEESKDTLGGFSVLESDIYTGTIKMAYAGVSDKGSKFVSLIVDIDGKEYRETLYVTNKKGENFFLNKSDPSKKVPLPGFTTMEDICLIATEKYLHQQVCEEKVVNIYSSDAGKEVPTNVPVLTELLGKKIALAILKQIENKQVKTADGSYVADPSGETVERNNIHKVFHPELKVTVREAMDGKEAAFWDAWLNQNQGKTRSKVAPVDGSARVPQAAGKPAPSASATAPKSLFGAKK